MLQLDPTAARTRGNEAENDVDVSLGLASAEKEQLRPIAILAWTP